MAAARQLEALTHIIDRVTGVAEARGIPILLAHGQGAGGGGLGEELQGGYEGPQPCVPGASEVVQPSGWMPRNTIVRGVFKELGNSGAGGGAAGGGAAHPKAAGGLPAGGGSVQPAPTAAQSPGGGRAPVARRP